jgi:alkanesulfonate monooxygenase SsuD/methylene tetrahydromethanopterin reductase-like flavin-dependent oxidoreductase (luciferase family)
MSAADDGRPHGPVAGPLGLILPTFPQRGSVPSASELAETCRSAEQAGAGALWACDHLFWHTPCIECLCAIGVSAASTSLPAVGSCVLQLPLRDTAVVAKQAASLQTLSSGRLVLGVGIGSHRDEYHAAGKRFKERAARLDTGIDIMRRTWSSAQSAEHYSQLPAPGTIPVWFGGSSEAALRRSARIGDGWMPVFVAPDDYCAALERLDKEADRAGRDPSEVYRAAVVFVAIGGHEERERGLDWMSSLYSLPPAAFERHLLSGGAREVSRSMARFLEAGAQHVAAFVTCDEPSSRFEDLAGEFGHLIGTQLGSGTHRGPGTLPGVAAPHGHPKR